jgi:hypothetical protein
MHMNTTDAKSPRRLLAVASLVLLLVLGPISLLWNWAARPLNEDAMYPFLGLTLVAFASGIIFFLTARSVWRWLLLTLIFALGVVAGLLLLDDSIESLLVFSRFQIIIS